MKDTLWEVKLLLSEKFQEDITVNIADKPGWLILKQKRNGKTFGCIRLNKRSFITLYIDTKESINLSVLNQTEVFKNIDIQSRTTGNFTQNKFKFKKESEMPLVISIIRLVLESGYIKTGEKIRS